MNPWEVVGKFVAEFISDRRKFKASIEWLRFLFSMITSAVVGFLFICGTVLISPPHSWPIAVGSGMMSAAVILCVYVRRSPLTKGMLFVFPAAEAKEEINTDVQILQK